MIDFCVETRLFGPELLSFKLPANDARCQFFTADYKLEYEFGEYFIVAIEDEIREDGLALKAITAEASWMRLAERKRPGGVIITGTVHRGLELILAGTNWHSGVVNDDATEYTMEVTDGNVLGMIWQWAKITGSEVSFSGGFRLVDMPVRVGADLGYSFRYGKNLKSIKRTEVPPRTTRLYPYGKNDLDIKTVNGGVEYIENFDYYTDQGMTLEDAEEEYLKEEILVDTSFVDVNALFANAERYLDLASQGQLFYETNVLDLAALVGYNEAQFRCGDTVWVEGEPISISARARVSRRKQYPYESERDEVELSFNAIDIPDVNQAGARSDTSQEWELFESRNTVSERRVRNASTILHRIRLRTSAEAEWIVNYTIEGVGVGAGTVTITPVDDESGLPLWPAQTFTVADGVRFNWQFSYASKEVTQGTHTMTLRAVSSGADIGLDIPTNQTAFWILARGSLRENVVLPNSIRYDVTETKQTFTVPDDVEEIMIEAHGGGSTGGGLGCMVRAKFPVVAGSVLAVWVGERGESPAGGYPNGGQGCTANNQGNGGGGSSSVSPDGDFDAMFPSSMIVAPGAGGSGSNDISLNNPGNATFYGGTPSDAEGHPGSGATQTAPGQGIGSGEDGDTDGQGYGGDGAALGATLHSEGGGAGGGWHGGGAGGHDGNSRGGGGGSGMVDSTAWDLEITDAEQTGDGWIIISWETPAGE